MDVARFMRNRKGDNRMLAQRDLDRTPFPIGEIVSLPQTTQQYILMGAYKRTPEVDVPSVPGRVQLIAERWCNANCTKGWRKFRGTCTWAFEDQAEALHFRLAFS